MFCHIPAKFDLPFYTASKLPCRIKMGNSWIQMPYFELVKNRSGSADYTIPMVNKLHRFDFDEMDPEAFKMMHQQFKNGEEPVYEQQTNLFN